MNIFGQPAGQSRKYKIMGYKKIYSESTREVIDLDGPCSNPITIKTP